MASIHDLLDQNTLTDLSAMLADWRRDNGRVRQKPSQRQVSPHYIYRAKFTKDVDTETDLGEANAEMIDDDATKLQDITIKLDNASPGPYHNGDQIMVVKLHDTEYYTVIGGSGSRGICTGRALTANLEGAAGEFEVDLVMGVDFYGAMFDPSSTPLTVHNVFNLAWNQYQALRIQKNMTTGSWEVIFAACPVV
jgi:hypothetical protein